MPKWMMCWCGKEFRGDWTPQEALIVLGNHTDIEHPEKDTLMIVDLAKAFQRRQRQDDRDIFNG